MWFQEKATKLFACYLGFENCTSASLTLPRAAPSPLSAAFYRLCRLLAPPQQVWGHLYFFLSQFTLELSLPAISIGSLQLLLVTHLPPLLAAPGGRCSDPAKAPCSAERRERAPCAMKPVLSESPSPRDPPSCLK